MKINKKAPAQFMICTPGNDKEETLSEFYVDSSGFSEMTQVSHVDFSDILILYSKENIKTIHYPGKRVTKGMVAGDHAESKKNITTISDFSFSVSDDYMDLRIGELDKLKIIPLGALASFLMMKLMSQKFKQVVLIFYGLPSPLTYYSAIKKNGDHEENVIRFPDPFSTMTYIDPNSLIVNINKTEENQHEINVDQEKLKDCTIVDIDCDNLISMAKKARCAIYMGSGYLDVPIIWPVIGIASGCFAVAGAFSFEIHVQSSYEALNDSMKVTQEKIATIQNDTQEIWYNAIDFWVDEQRVDLSPIFIITEKISSVSPIQYLSWDNASGDIKMSTMADITIGNIKLEEFRNNIEYAAKDCEIVEQFDIKGGGGDEIIININCHIDGGGDLGGSDI